MKFPGHGPAAAALCLLGILALALLIAAQPPAARSYAVGAPADERLTYGFWSGEANAEGSYRWSDGDSTLRLFGYGAAAGTEVTLRLIGPQGSREQTTTLRLSAGALTLLEGPSPASWRNYHLLLPPPGPGWATPELLVGGTTTERVSGDARGVGVAISRVAIAPLRGARPLAVAEYAGFIALLLLLVLAGLRRAAGGGAAVAATLALGGLLLAWSRRDPVGMAYLLPPLWGFALLPVGVAVALWLPGRLAPLLGGRPLALAAGLAAALLGTGLLWAGAWAPLGAALLIGGALAAAAALAAGPEPAGAPEAPGASGARYPLAVLGCALLALALRLPALGSVPLGLWRDEARHGLLALRILGDPSYRPVYVPGQADIPALLFYLQTLSVGALGPTIAAARVVPALAGSATVLSIALLASRLWGRGAGLAAALLLAASAWHITLSRLAFAAVLDPLLSLAALALLWGVAAEGRPLWRRLAEGAGAGTALGLALYTYHPARLMPLAAVLWVLLRLGADRGAWRRAAAPLLAGALAACVVAGPLLLYWAGDAGGFNRRVGQVGLSGGEDEKRPLSVALDLNMRRYLLMWHGAGDFNARHNIPSSPMLDPLTGALFLTGLIALLGRRSPAAPPLLAVLAIGLVPGLLSNDAPHAVRTVDAIAPALLVASYAAVQGARLLASQPAAARWGPPTGAALALALVLFNGWSYFGRVPFDPRVWDGFRYTAESAIGQEIQRGRCAGPSFVPERVAQTDVLRYLAHGRPVSSFDPFAPPERFPAGACVLVPAGDPAELRARLARPTLGVEPTAPARYPGTGEPVFWRYELP